MGHDFSKNEQGLWWCDTEDVVSDECSDLDRCAGMNGLGCICNPRRWTKTLYVEVAARNEDEAEEFALSAAAAAADEDDVLFVDNEGPLSQGDYVLPPNVAREA